MVSLSSHCKECVWVCVCALLNLVVLNDKCKYCKCKVDWAHTEFHLKSAPELALLKRKKKHRHTQAERILPLMEITWSSSHVVCLMCVKVEQILYQHFMRSTVWNLIVLNRRGNRENSRNGWCCHANIHRLIYACNNIAYLYLSLSTIWFFIGIFKKY